MEQHPSPEQDWVQDAERWICRIDGVRHCKIDLDRHGEVAAIHVVADKTREPRHIVRDVESLLKARLALNVYYKKIGVVQVLDPAAAGVTDMPAVAAAEGRNEETAAESPADVPHQAAVAGGGVVTAAGDADPSPSPAAAAAPRTAPATTTAAPSRPADPEPPAAAPAGRPRPWESADWQGPHPVTAAVETTPPARRVECRGVGVVAEGALLTASVELGVGERSVRAEERGPNQPGLENQLLGRATVTALAALVVDPVTLNLSDVREVDLAGEPVVCVAVDLVEGRRRERLFGCCSRHAAAQMAPVLAVLAALNRRLGLFEWRERID